MASNFNNDTLLRGTGDDRAAARVERRDHKPGDGPVSPTARLGGVCPLPLVPVAAARRRTGNQEFCTHREVKPYAGTQGFDPDAWCPGCQHYKLRRAPKKRNPATITRD